MLNLLHTAIARLLAERSGFDPSVVDVRFERPTRQWVDSLMRPTLNFCLFNVAENIERRIGGAQMSRSDSRAEFKVPPRRFDLQYLVGVFATLAEDEYTLLWRTLATLLRYNVLPVDLLPEAIVALDVPISTQVAQPNESERPFELWNAYELPPRPALIYTITAPLDLAIEFNAPLVLSRTIRVDRIDGVHALETLPMRIGGMVRTAYGDAVAAAQLAVEGSSQEVTTDSEGRFSLQIFRSGPISVHISAPTIASQTVQLDIPSESYDIVVV